MEPRFSCHEAQHLFVVRQALTRCTVVRSRQGMPSGPVNQLVPRVADSICQNLGSPLRAPSESVPAALFQPYANEVRWEVEVVFPAIIAVGQVVGEQILLAAYEETGSVRQQNFLFL